MRAARDPERIRMRATHTILLSHCVIKRLVRLSKKRRREKRLHSMRLEADSSSAVASRGKTRALNWRVNMLTS
jgi:hypothetical protein